MVEWLRRASRLRNGWLWLPLAIRQPFNQINRLFNRLKSPGANTCAHRLTGRSLSCSVATMDVDCAAAACDAEADEGSDSEPVRCSDSEPAGAAAQQKKKKKVCCSRVLVFSASVPTRQATTACCAERLLKTPEGCSPLLRAEAQARRAVAVLCAREAPRAVDSQGAPWVRRTGEALRQLMQLSDCA